MRKKLSEMTLEELWQLFPIILTGHRDVWRTWYAEEEAFLRSLLPQAVRISHVGSTAIPAIWAKPIIDMLVEVPAKEDMLRAAEALAANGYRCMSRSDVRLSFNKGYTEEGFAERVFHLHLRLSGDNAELYFRDYLSEHPAVAAQYEQLKLGLWKEFEHDRDEYTRRKTDFVTRYTTEAKALYGNRY